MGVTWICGGVEKPDTCSTCTEWMRWGVALGWCSTKKESTIDTDRCKKYNPRG